ncbi:MAG TPA: ABC transporter ATP-binding protein [Acidimicrobiales bacterium]|nr:ABC transporter ATP-binding protein [Acidimicrobiales bacterium]
MTAIQVENLRHCFHHQGAELPLLQGVDLSVPAGGYASLVGQSGSGKTTLLAIIGGLEPVRSGTVRVAGRELGRLSSAELARFRCRSVGFVFQHFGLLDSLTAEENIDLPQAWAGSPHSERRRRVAELLEAVGLTGRRSHLPHELSGGERQRVAIARALVNRPRVVLADEPTGNLDRVSAGPVISLLESMPAREGSALLVVTHNPELAGRAGRRYALADGTVTEVAGAG